MLLGTGLVVCVVLFLVHTAYGQLELATVGTGESPIFVRVSPDGREALVLNFFSRENNVLVVDLATARVIREFTVGLRPQFADFISAGEVLIGNDESFNVTFADIHQPALLGTVRVGNRAEAVRVHPAGALALVANGLDGNLSVVDLTSRSVTNSIPVGRNPRAISFTADGSLALVANGRSNEISMVDMATGREIGVIPVGENPTSVEMIPASNRAVVTNARDNTASIIDLAERRVIATIPVGRMPTQVAVHPAGTLAFVTNSGGDSVSIVSLILYEHVRTFQVGRIPVSLALTPDGTRLLVVSQLDNLLRIFDVRNLDPRQTSAPPVTPQGGSGIELSEAPPPPLPETSDLTPTIFVDAAAPVGGDGSQTNPFRSITAAIRAAREGDVIFVASGIYSPSRTDETIPMGLPTSELPNGPPPNLAIIGAGAETTLIDSEGAVRVEGGIANANGVLLRSSGMRFEGFTVQSDGVGILVGSERERVVGVHVANNLARFNGVHGIGVQDADDCVIANNSAISNDGNGIALNNSACALTGNTANGNVLDGILIGSGGSITASGNLMRRNGSSGFEANNRTIPPNPPRAMRVRLEGNIAEENGGQQFATVGSGFLITEGALAESLVNNRAAGNVTAGIAIFQDARAELVGGNESSSNRGEGILIQRGAEVETLCDNVFNNNEQNGIAVSFNSHAASVYGNTVTGNAQNGIGILVNSSVDGVVRNTVSGNRANGIVAVMSSQAVVADNEVRDNATTGIQADSGSTVRAVGNTVAGHPAGAGLAGTNGGLLIDGANHLSNNLVNAFANVQPGTVSRPSVTSCLNPDSSASAASMPVEASVSLAAGFYVAEVSVESGEESGAWLMSVNADRTSGGINLGTGISPGVISFAAFFLGRPDTISITTPVVFAQSREPLLIGVRVRDPDGRVFAETEPSGNPELRVSLPSGFFIAEFTSSRGNGVINIELLSQAFVGGINLGGTIDPGQVGFAAFNLPDSLVVRLNLMGRSVVGPGGAAGMKLRVRDLSDQVFFTHRGGG